MGNNTDALQNNARLAIASQPDLVELRIDGLNGLSDKNAPTLLSPLRELIPCPLLLTYRTERDGGPGSPDIDFYLALYHALIKARIMDLLDVEISVGAEAFASIRQACPLPIVASWHSFTETPSADQMVTRLLYMQSLGADIAKIAVMPNCESDISALLEAARLAEKEMQIPMILIGMGTLGQVTRTSCAQFHSCLTFATAGAASAPGQMDVETVRKAIQITKG